MASVRNASVPSARRQNQMWQEPNWFFMEILEEWMFGRKLKPAQKLRLITKNKNILRVEKNAGTWPSNQYKLATSRHWVILELDTALQCITIVISFIHSFSVPTWFWAQLKPIPAVI